jgi:hypothetical protein
VKRSPPPERRTPLRRGKPLRSTPQGIDPALRARVLTRDGGCVAAALGIDVVCWGPLDPHHVLPRGRGGADHEGNLITLCRAHHDWVHGFPDLSRALGLLR